VREGKVPEQRDLVAAGGVALGAAVGRALGQHRVQLVLEVVENVVPGTRPKRVLPLKPRLHDKHFYVRFFDS
jgi:hypothetical protein